MNGEWERVVKNISCSLSVTLPKGIENGESMGGQSEEVRAESRLLACWPTLEQVAQPSLLPSAGEFSVDSRWEGLLVHRLSPVCSHSGSLNSSNESTFP